MHTIWLTTKVRTTVRWAGGCIVCAPGQRTRYLGPLDGLDGMHGIQIDVEYSDEDIITEQTSAARGADEED